MAEKINRTHLTVPQLNTATHLIVGQGIREQKALRKALEDLGIKIGQTKAYELLKLHPAREVDKPADWGDLDKIFKQGVARDHIDALSILSTWIEDKFAPFENERFAPAPTLRNIKWQSYVMSIAPSIMEPLDLFVLGELLSAREMYLEYGDAEYVPMGDVIKATPNMSHLVSYLRYKPFENLRNTKRYMDAINRNAIKSVNHLNEDGSINRQYEGLGLPPHLLVGNDDGEVEVYPTKWATALILWHCLGGQYTSHPDFYFLPSQKFLVGTEGKPLVIGFTRYEHTLTISEKDIELYYESYWHESEQEGECQCIKCTDKQFWDK